MSQRRKPGEGTVRQLPSGRFQPGITLATGGRKWSKTTFATREEADEALLSLRAVVADLPAGGATFAAYGRSVLDAVERRKSHAPLTVDTYRGRFEQSIAPAPWATRPMRSLSQREFRRFMDEEDSRRARSTATITLAVARMVFAQAIRDGLIDDDPTAGFRFQRRSRTSADEEARSFITPTQFDALCAVATDAESCMMRFAYGTGMRISEMIALHRADVDIERGVVTIRYGGRHGGQLQPTKGRKVRRVPLVGPAYDAAREWVDRHLGALPNPHGLMFPRPDGEYRSRKRILGETARVTRWSAIVAAAGLSDVTPAIVWHWFRHSCATALLSGLWGHKWSPDEVREMLGHAKLSTTLVYARIVDDRLEKIAPLTRSRDRQRAGTAANQEGAHNGHLRTADEWFREVRPKVDQAVIDIARGSMDGAQELAALWLAHPGVRLAMEVLAGGPFAANRAVELARLTAETAPEHERESPAILKK